MGWLGDQFKDMSFDGQAKNPLQILVNPMAVGTVGIAMAKDANDKNPGWFDNLKKSFQSDPAKPPTTTGNTPAPATNPNQMYYIIAGVVLVIIVIAVMANRSK